MKLKSTRVARILALAALLGTGVPSHAVVTVIPASEVTDIFVTTLSAVVQLTTAGPTSPGCGTNNNDKRFVMIRWDINSNNKVMYASVLAAYLTGKKVEFAVDPAVVACHPFGGGIGVAIRATVKN